MSDAIWVVLFLFTSLKLKQDALVQQLFGENFPPGV